MVYGHGLLGFSLHYYIYIYIFFTFQLFEIARETAEKERHSHSAKSVNNGEETNESRIVFFTTKVQVRISMAFALIKNRFAYLCSIYIILGRNFRILK